jgi:dynein heavy chain 1
MVWFSEDVLSTEMIFENYMSCLRNIPLEEADEDSGFGKKSESKEDVLSPTLQVLAAVCITQIVPVAIEWEAVY